MMENDWSGHLTLTFELCPPHRYVYPHIHVYLIYTCTQTSMCKTHMYTNIIYILMVKETVIYSTSFSFSECISEMKSVNENKFCQLEKNKR